MSNSQQRFEAKFPMPDFAEWDASRNNYTHAHALTMFAAVELEYYKGLWKGWQAAEAQSQPIAWMLCRINKGVTDVLELTCRESRVAEWYTDDFNYVQPLALCDTPPQQVTVCAAPQSEAA
jgi:hypothetical protein